jgi:hypothetical protein
LYFFSVEQTIHQKNWVIVLHHSLMILSLDHLQEYQTFVVVGVVCNEEKKFDGSVI